MQTQPTLTAQIYTIIHNFGVIDTLRLQEYLANKGTNTTRRTIRKHCKKLKALGFVAGEVEQGVRITWRCMKWLVPLPRTITSDNAQAAIDAKVIWLQERASMQAAGIK